MPIEIDEQHDAVRPLFGKTSGRRAKDSIRFSQFVSPLSGAPVLTGRQCCNKDKVGKYPEPLGTILSRVGLEFLLAWLCTWCVSRRDVSSEPSTPESLASDDPLRTGLVVRPERNPLAVFGLKATRFHCQIPNIRDGRRSPLRCDRLLSKSCAGADGARQESNAKSPAETHTIQLRTSSPPRRELVALLLHEHELGSLHAFH